jgi:hypothetical protein
VPLESAEEVFALPRYRLGRRASSLKLANLGVVVATEPAVEPVAEDEGPSYRDLQAEAKAAGIPANQSAEELKAALGKSDE